MKKIKFIALCFIGLLAMLPINAKDYNASYFGIRSNGVTMNTTAIQKAIDYISENGGGTLHFRVGRYLTGQIDLKSNVTIELHEGAVLMGSTNIYDYRKPAHCDFGLISAFDQENIAIIGKGVIEANGRELALNITDQIHKGVIIDDHSLDRPREAKRPHAIFFHNCKNSTLKDIVVKNAANWVCYFDMCDGMLVEGITVDSKEFWNNDGIDFGDCKNVIVKNCFVDCSDDGICLKSHRKNGACENILIRDNVVRSSASGIKFGTWSIGGYKNIQVINNKVYDTFRSAFTAASPDGAVIENILVDSLYAYNVGNALYLRVNARHGDNNIGFVENITIRNVYCEIAEEKPDAGYLYEGPVVSGRENIAPSSIVGIPARPVRNVTLENIEIVYPGGGNKYRAYRGTDPASLDSIPNMIRSYPEFSQFKELPAWAFWVRHAENISFKNVKFTAKKADYRPAIVVQESKNVTFEKATSSNPGNKKKIHTYKVK
jgi:hypothetical protein